MLQRSDLIALHGNEWLTGTVINYFMAMLVSRSAANQQLSSPDSNLLDIWAYNTYFYTMLKLTKDVSKSTKSLTKNGKSATIFSKDVVFVPIHQAGNHWCMGVLNFKKGQIEYYDHNIRSALF